MKKITSSLLVITLLSPVSVFAYLDPGTGSMLFSALIGIVATLLFVGKSFVFKLSHLSSLISGKKIKESHRESIVFYSEGGQYWNVFKPIIEELNSRSISCRYITSSKDDPGLAVQIQLMKSRYVPEGSKLFFYLNTLDADIVIMTTPGLDVLQIKKSKGVGHYCHVAHSSGGCGGGYRTYGLDYFDSVLLGGEGAVQEIRELENKRGTQVKELAIIGCTYLDVLRPKVSTVDTYFANDKKTVLLAPTWGSHGLLSKYGKELISNILKTEKYNVIIRPHPQSYKIENDMLNDLEVEFKSSGVIWDTDFENIKAMASSDIMISDFSGVVFDYIFLFEKPILTFTGSQDKRASNAIDLDEPIWNVKTLLEIGCIVTQEDIPNMSNKISEQLNEGSTFKSLMSKMKNDMDKFPGESGARGADFIINKMAHLKS